ncbi:MAG: alcohol dehydrogenase catalytic domain-containing protein [Chitinivibrionales bacterium]|nr:alcohol dehydrogenase catalytic domain-containing protein [Chitinivibrionales bacterium]
MKAVFFDGTLKIIDMEIPRRKEHEVLIRISKAGICNTDHEILKGYVPGFTGIPGHEFLGHVQEAENRSLIGRRVTGEINCACGKCDYCAAGLGRHCPDRSVIGIMDHPGAFAEYICIPESTVVEIPEHIPDSRAIFIEPLAAACEILEQIEIPSQSRVLLIGDGKLALLIGLVVSSTGADLTVVGKHENKLSFLEESNIRTVLLTDFVREPYDIVIEASGSSSAFGLAVECTKPRGTIVLKSTCAENLDFNPSGIVVNELMLVGSRCGRFKDARAFIEKGNPRLEKLITKAFPLGRALDAFRESEKKDTIKVILKNE